MNRFLLTKFSFIRLILAIFLLSTPFVHKAYAQNTSGVFSPKVKEGSSGMEFRMAYDPDTDVVVQRLHYQKAISDTGRWRLVGQWRRTDDDFAEQDYVRGEYLWQLSDDNASWQTAFRFDGIVRFNGRNDTFTTHWANEFSLSQGLKMRAILGATRAFGTDASSDIVLQTRLRINKSLNEVASGGIEAFSVYGAFHDPLPFDEQRQQIGPYINYKLGDGWTLFSSALFGVSDATADINWRFNIIKSF